MFPTDSSAPYLPEFRSLAMLTDVPIQSEILPDGQRVLVSGDTEDMARFLAQDSAHSDILSASPSLLGCAQIIRQFTEEFRPQDLLTYMEGLHPPLTELEGMSSLVSLEEMAQTLTDFDIPAHLEQAQSLEDLAHHLESGSGALAGVNLGELWNAPDVYGSGDANAVAVALAVARASETGVIVAWYLNDVVARDIRVRVDASRMERAWLEAGGWLVVTDIARSRRRVE